MNNQSNKSTIGSADWLMGAVKKNPEACCCWLPVAPFCCEAEASGPTPQVQAPAGCRPARNNILIRILGRVVEAANWALRE